MREIVIIFTFLYSKTSALEDKKENSTGTNST